MARPDTIDLAGRRILFVGGRIQNVAHWRRMVESCNGRFAHHDGGVEASIHRLGGKVERADAVLFPVKCVSHAALTKVKTLCRIQVKPFKPLRSTGLDAIAEALAWVRRSSDCHPC